MDITSFGSAIYIYMYSQGMHTYCKGNMCIWTQPHYYYDNAVTNERLAEFFHTDEQIPSRDVMQPCDNSRHTGPVGIKPESGSHSAIILDLRGQINGYLFVIPSTMRAGISHNSR